MEFLRASGSLHLDTESIKAKNSESAEVADVGLSNRCGFYHSKKNTNISVIIRRGQTKIQEGEQFLNLPLNNRYRNNPATGENHNNQET